MQITIADTVKLERYENLIHLVALVLFDGIVKQELYEKVLLIEDGKQTLKTYLNKFIKEYFKNNTIETNPANAMVKTASFYTINTNFTTLMKFVECL